MQTSHDTCSLQDVVWLTVLIVGLLGEVETLFAAVDISSNCPDWLASFDSWNQALYQKSSKKAIWNKTSRDRRTRLTEKVSRIVNTNEKSNTDLRLFSWAAPVDNTAVWSGAARNTAVCIGAARHTVRVIPTQFSNSVRKLQQSVFQHNGSINDMYVGRC